MRGLTSVSHHSSSDDEENCFSDYKLDQAQASPEEHPSSNVQKGQLEAEK